MLGHRLTSFSVAGCGAGVGSCASVVQVSTRMLPYFGLKAEGIVDLLEKDKEGANPQIQFRMQGGNFDVLQVEGV
eukprot:924907-Prorocentrum_minimum.AAC.1